MAAKLKKYFPMIRKREEFLNICTGVRGLKF